MKQALNLLGASALALSALTMSASAGAQVAPPPETLLITVDENGHGSILVDGTTTSPLTGVLAHDPGPGGLDNVLTYTLVGALTVIPGDVHLTDADFNNAFLDVIRFNQTVGAVAIPGTIVFYSDNVDGFDALADTASPPILDYGNVITIPEVGPEGNNGAFYTPTANQPGFITGFAATYHFISDSSVPEPSTWAMMLAGFGAIGLALRRRRRTLALA